MPDPAALLQSWTAELATHIEGWDFSTLSGRMWEDDPPWDFDAVCREEILQLWCAMADVEDDDRVLASSIYPHSAQASPDKGTTGLVRLWEEAR